MKLQVTTERHYLRNADGVFAQGVENYHFFTRYLARFDEVEVIARVRSTAGPIPADHGRADGPGVKFCAIDDFSRLQELAARWPSVRRTLRHAAQRDGFVSILRVPGLVSYLMWRELHRSRKAFGLEVVADPAEAYVREVFGSVLAAPIRWLALGALRRQCATAASVAFVTRDQLQRRYRPRTDKVFTYSSIDLDDDVFDRASGVHERLAAAPDRLETPTIAFVGNLGRPFKGFDILLRALARLRSEWPGLRLVAIGDGHLREGYAQLARELGVGANVEFRGYVQPGHPIFDELGRADLLVLPSRREGLPRIIIEGMAVGLPCVCSDVCGAAELLEPADIVPREDPAALSDRIADMLSSRERRLVAARRNHERARGYARSRLQPERQRFYESLIAAVGS